MDMHEPPPEPWLQPWPAAGLEALGKCPLCNNTNRVVLHQEVVDDSFRTAPGRWTLWRCQHCSSGYLDPRPTANTIHEAYRSYYTHQKAATAQQPPSLRQRWRTKLVNGYVNQRYGARLQPASLWGPLFCRLFAEHGLAADRDARHLPKSTARADRLLDVGCGDGDYIAHAQRLGWRVLGLEPDARAAEHARQHGVEVLTGGIDALDGQADRFDVITLSHVIEHVHDPVLLLRNCHRLLKPGGRVWIGTPNIDAVGHQVFGRHWRGLETPRHLVLFSGGSLRTALRDAGFTDIQDVAIPSPRRWIFKRSLAMASNQWAGADVPLTQAQVQQIKAADRRDRRTPAGREFLTLQARKK